MSRINRIQRLGRLWIHETIAEWSADQFDNVMTNFIVNNRSGALKTDANSV